jgi:uncharacterized membrane protein YoaK (UPF0700 family)
MHVEERDCLIVMLAATAGSTDAWSYFGLGHVFIANMTGNTVLLGAAFSVGKAVGIVRTAVAIGCYVCGVFLGTALLETVFAPRVWSASPAKEEVWPQKISWVLGVESLLLITGAVVWARLGGGNATVRHVLVALAAVALGLQSAAMQSLKLPGIVTTYITGTWTTLVAGLSRVATGRRRVDTPNAQLKMQAAVLAAYCASAAVSGLLFRQWPPAMGVLPAATATFVALYGATGKPGRVPGKKL